MLIHTPTHTWLKQLTVAYLPGPSTPLSNRVASDLMEFLHQEGHTTQALPTADTDVILTTARLGEPLGWREAFMFTARRRYGLHHVPTVFTILHATAQQFNNLLSETESILRNGIESTPRFAGVPETASRTLFQQGKRGGAIMYLLRILQIQSKSIRVLLVVGDEKPDAAFLFDLVGAHPQIRNDDPQSFYKDITTRIMTAASTAEITRHQAVEPELKRTVWEALPTLRHMTQASQELGKRDFFTEMIHVSDVAEIPGFSDAISQQYSEGCFATWDVQINGLLTTITGSARPVRKENITDKDLAVIVGIKPQYDGALIRKVEGHPNRPPSSEAVEMIGMDLKLPRIALTNGVEAPVIRSKLHGHRGVARSTRPGWNTFRCPKVIFTTPSPAPPTPSTAPCRRRFKLAALRDPSDPRQIVFTVLPGHGVVIVEKWVAGKQPFQVIWEGMDRGDIEVSNDIPQGPFTFRTEGQRPYWQPTRTR